MGLQRASAEMKLATVNAQERIISGFAAFHSNVDRVNDIIDPTASVKAVGRLQAPADVAVFIGHQAHTLPVGIPVKIEARPEGLWTETKVKPGPAGDDLLATAEFLMAHGQTLGMSIGYRALANTPERTPEGKLIRRLMDYELHEYSFAARQSIANPAALVAGVKTDLDDASPAADWTPAYIGALPDSAFLYVAAGAQDDAGRTVPSAKRHYPVRNAEGCLDVARLQDAVKALPSATLDLDATATRRLQARAQRLLEVAQESPSAELPPEWQDGIALDVLGLAVAAKALAAEIAEEQAAMRRLGIDCKAGQRMRFPMREKLRALRGVLDEVLQWAEYADRDDDPKAVVDWYRRQLALTSLVAVGG